MTRTAFIGCFAALSLGSSALAAELPNYLNAGQTYSTNQKACGATQDGDLPDDSYTLEKNGIFGYEFGCVFVDIKPVVYADNDDPVFSHIMTASCGDDSGVTRPDSFHLSYYEGILTVTSQTDYLYELLRPSEGENTGFTGFVNTQFEMCQPK